MYCKKFPMHALSDTSKLIRLRCKKWSCEFCAEINKREWRYHLRDKFKDFDQFSFITITCLGWQHRENMTLAMLMKSWPNLRKRLKRAFGKFSYVRVFEQHKSGEFHLHALITYCPRDAFTAQGKRSKAWSKVGRAWRYRGEGYAELLHHVNELGLGYVCDLTPLLCDEKHGQANGVIAYVTKYMHKQERLMKGVRWVQCDKGTPKRGRVGDDVWELCHRVTAETLDYHEGQINDLTRRKIITYDDLVDGSYPPPLDN